MSEPQPGLVPLVTIPTSAAGFPEFYVHLHEPVAVETSATVPSVDLSEPQRSDYFRIKSASDRAITTVLAILAIPLMAIVALAIVLLDGRPIFYRQRRVGKHGREFWIWKFRTMRRDAESSTGAVWSNQSDSRVTPLGRWLRCSHLDELPQFFNILAGEMSLVGPRPERPEFAHELARQLPNYMHRTAVRPGITGLAQLRLGYDHSVTDVRKKLKLDLQYIRTATFSLDIWLLACTIPYIARQLTHKGMIALHRATRFTNSSQPESSCPQSVTPPLRCDPSSDLVRSKAVPHVRRSAARNLAMHATDSNLASGLKVFSPDRAEEECN